MAVNKLRAGSAAVVAELVDDLFMESPDLADEDQQTAQLRAELEREGLLREASPPQVRHRNGQPYIVLSAERYDRYLDTWDIVQRQRRRQEDDQARGDFEFILRLAGKHKSLRVIRERASEEWTPAAIEEYAALRASAHGLGLHDIGRSIQGTKDNRRKVRRLIVGELFDRGVSYQRMAPIFGVSHVALHLAHRRRKG